MQIRISPSNYEKCYPKRLKRLFQTHINLRTYNKFIPEMERAVVGNIPIEIIKLFPKSSRAEGIKNIQNALTLTTLSLREGYNNIRKLEEFSFLDCNYRPSKYAKRLAHKGQKTLNAELTKIFGENTIKAKIDYAGDGAFGNVFKLSLRDSNGQKIMHDKALKVYHRVGEGNLYYSKIHNTYAEANFWTFLKRVAGHKLDNTQYTKHYISDLHSGYCLTEFIDPEIPKTKSEIPIFDLFEFRTPHDKTYNPRIMGKEYDGGGYEITENFTADKIILRFAKRIYNSGSPKKFQENIELLKQLINNPKTQNREKLKQVLAIFDW